MTRFGRIMSVIAIAVTLSPVASASHTPGHITVPDLRYDLGNAPNPFVDHVVPTGCLLFTSPGMCGRYGTIDEVLVKAITAAIPVGGVIVVDPNSTGAPPFPPSNLRLTTFYGIDFDPNSDFDSLQLTGFNAAAPEVIFSNETYVGLTNDYPADELGLIALGDLGTSFPELDLSRFVGDPASVVYVFSAEVPASDFAIIPEPSALLLAVVSGSAFGLLWRRRPGA